MSPFIQGYEYQCRVHPPQPNGTAPGVTASVHDPKAVGIPSHTTPSTGRMDSVA